MRGIVTAAARRAWIWNNKPSFVQCPGQRPRLLVDVSAIIRHDAQTGIQRVVRGVWSELSRRSGHDFDAIPVHASRRRGYCYAPFDFLDNRPLALEHRPAAIAPGHQFLRLDLSAHLMPKYVEQIRAWRLIGAKAHIVVYDLLPLQHPEWFTKPASDHFRKWFRLVTHEVDQALCISNDVALSLLERLPNGIGPKIGRLHMGADISGSKPSAGVTDDITTTLGRMRLHPTVLMVGTIEPRKGHSVALDAFEYLWRGGAINPPHLVIVGKGGWNTSQLQHRLSSHSESGKRLHWLDCVSDEALCELYEAASGVLVASEAEGFGLPLMEAAVHGRRVLARDLPVFREQSLPGVIYFQEDSPAALGRKVMDLMQEGSESSKNRCNLPSWGHAVDRLLVDIGFERSHKDADTQAHLKRRDNSNLYAS